jgi:hypothetical protein
MSEASSALGTGRRSQSVPRQQHKRRRSPEDEEDTLLTKKFCRLSVNKKRNRSGDESTELLDMLDELELENKKKKRKQQIRSRSLDKSAESRITDSSSKKDKSGKFLRFIYDKNNRLDLHQMHIEHRERISSADYSGPNLPLGKPTPSAKPFS